MSLEDDLKNEANALKMAWAEDVAELKTLNLNTGIGRARIQVLRNKLRPSIRRLSEIAAALGSPIPDVR
jgi:hypothetical protein